MNTTTTSTRRSPGKGLTKAADGAAKKLRQEAWKISDKIDLRSIARGLNPGWESHLCLDEYLLLKHSDWHDGTEPTVGVVAQFPKYTFEKELLARQCLLAVRANNFNGPKHTITYQLVMDLEHPLARGVVARIDVETGAVKLGKPWLRAEELAKRVLTPDQTEGRVCAVCGGDDNGMLWSLPTRPLRCCRGCDAPDDRMARRWLENGVQPDSAQGIERATLGSGVAS